MRQDIRHRLRLALERSGLTQAELARAVDASTATVSDWFNPERHAVPDGEKMMLLPQALRVSGHWLLTGEDPVTSPGRGGTGLDRAFNAGARSVLAELRRLLDQLFIAYGGASTVPPREAAAASAAIQHATQQRSQKRHREERPSRS